MKTKFVAMLVLGLICGAATLPDVQRKATTTINDPVSARQQHGPPPTRVSLFFGSGDQTAIGNKMARDLGERPYTPGMVRTLEQMTAVAIAALKREGREYADDKPCAANISLSPGSLSLLLNTKDESCFVSFDSEGRITVVGGTRGSHGEGGWQRQYKNGQPVAPPNAGSSRD